MLLPIVGTIGCANDADDLLGERLEVVEQRLGEPESQLHVKFTVLRSEDYPEVDPNDIATLNDELVNTAWFYDDVVVMLNLRGRVVRVENRKYEDDIKERDRISDFLDEQSARKESVLGR